MLLPWRSIVCWFIERVSTTRRFSAFAARPSRVLAIYCDSKEKYRDCSLDTFWLQIILDYVQKVDKENTSVFAHQCAPSEKLWMNSGRLLYPRYSQCSRHEDGISKYFLFVKLTRGSGSNRNNRHASMTPVIAWSRVACITNWKKIKGLLESLAISTEGLSTLGARDQQSGSCGYWHKWCCVHALSTRSCDFILPCETSFWIMSFISVRTIKEVDCPRTNINKDGCAHRNPQWTRRGARSLVSAGTIKV